MPEATTYRQPGGRAAKSGSFASEKIEERSSSAFNPYLEVGNSYGHYRLNGQNVTLSFGILDKVFRSVFAQVQLKLRPVRRVLILGLGAGTVPAILRDVYGAHFEMTGVEIDAEVLRLGHKYFGLDQYPNLKIVEADAIEWVWESLEKFDLIVVDLFLDAIVPEAAQGPEYLRQLALLLHPEGLLLFNRLMHTPKLAEESEAFTRKMQEALPGTRYLKADSNRILVYEKK